MLNLLKIMLVSDSESIKNTLEVFFENTFELSTYNTFPFTDEFITEQKFEFILIDYLLFNEFNLKLLDQNKINTKIEKIKKSFPSAHLLIITNAKTMQEASKLFSFGIDNIILWPSSREIVLNSLKIEKEREKLKEVVRESSTAKRSYSPLNTTNTKFQEELDHLLKAAKSRSTILITGESGTGKSLLAKWVHLESLRAEQPFVSIHCGAIPEQLVESELFGHEKGAFTGAIKRKIGKFELANKGTIFLDEIGTVSHAVQVRLLQVIQERFIQRVGGEADIPLDIRLIAATNTNLKDMVKSGSFREDLFYRLNVFHIEMPPLRKRKEDIPSICRSILKKFNNIYQKNINRVSDDVLRVFNSYDWPGNIRELENILERSYVLENSDEISINNLSKDLLPESKELIEISPLSRDKLSLSQARKEVTEQFEKKYIVDLLIAHNGKLNKMSEEAEVTVRQLHKLMAKHNIKSKDYSISLKDHVD
jgi:DNA-binding NtrC family response regulator